MVSFHRSDEGVKKAVEAGMRLDPAVKDDAPIAPWSAPGVTRVRNNIAIPG